MADTEKTIPPSSSGNPLVPTGPHVFISHDTRDAELADAFAKLIKSVSAGMIKTFRSSDKKAGDGIDFGEEWYKRLMSALQSTTDVVCLFTERSIDRPWILFEAGVAKGKLDTPVTGVALGIALSRVSAGPFYQFQNMDDSEADLKKLVDQLARRVSGLELDADVVTTQIAAFKSTELEILKKIGSPQSKAKPQEVAEETAIAKLAEEMKGLPSRVAERLVEFDAGIGRRRRMKRFHPMMFDELMHAAGEPGDPAIILMVASFVRDDAPWLYELAMEVYRAIKSGNPIKIENEIERLKRFSDIILRGPIMEEFGFGDKESYILLRELPRMLYRTLDRTLSAQKERPKLRRLNRPRPTIKPTDPEKNAS